MPAFNDEDFCEVPEEVTLMNEFMASLWAAMARAGIDSSAVRVTHYALDKRTAAELGDSIPHGLYFSGPAAERAAEFYRQWEARFFGHSAPLGRKAVKMYRLQHPRTADQIFHTSRLFPWAVRIENGPTLKGSEFKVKGEGFAVPSDIL